MASFNDNPVLAELDDIASELEKTGNADLATLVDECSAEIQSSPQKTASKPKPKKKQKRRPKRSSKNRKSAGADRARHRQKIAQAMRKIARAQVSELEDIAAELMSEGEKQAALEVLRIAEDLDSDYDYSKHGDHEKPESKGDADKRYDREKNLPKPKGDDPKMDYPYEEGEGYPFNEGEKSAFVQQLDELLRLAEMGEEDEEGLDLGDEGEGEDEGMDEEDEGMDEEPMPEDEMPEMDEDEDELADLLAMMEGPMAAGGEGTDRDYAAGDDELDLGGLDLGDEGDEEEMPEEGEEDLGEEGEEDLGEEGEEDMGDLPSLDEDEDTEALDLMTDVEMQGPMGMGFKLSSTQDKKRVVALAKKLHAGGQTKLAQRVVNLLKKQSK